MQLQINSNDDQYLLNLANRQTLVNDWSLSAMKLSNFWGIPLELMLSSRFCLVVFENQLLFFFLPQAKYLSGSLVLFQTFNYTGLPPLMITALKTLHVVVFLCGVLSQIFINDARIKNDTEIIQTKR